MGLVIDSSVIIAIERGKLDFTQFDLSQPTYISSITVSELLVGAARSNNEERRIRKVAFVEHIINTIAVIHFGIEEARIYAELLNNLYQENITLGAHDVIISACAIANGHSVLTLNGRDFNKIKGLKVVTIKT